MVDATDGAGELVVIDDLGSLENQFLPRAIVKLAGFKSRPRGLVAEPRFNHWLLGDIIRLAQRDVDFMDTIDGRLDPQLRSARVEYVGRLDRVLRRRGDAGVVVGKAGRRITEAMFLRRVRVGHFDRVASQHIPAGLHVPQFVRDQEQPFIG
jgi:hypothetical protein